MTREVAEPRPALAGFAAQYCRNSGVVLDAAFSGKDLALAKEDRASIGPAQLDGRLDQRLENGLEVERRAADDLEDVGGGALPGDGLVEPALQIRNCLLGDLGNVIRHNGFSKLSGRAAGRHFPTSLSKHGGQSPARGISMQEVAG
jgi:hypothetical protein